MPESEFDKQVQEELQGLRLRPSAAVWENVEKELRHKRRRRVIVVFWLVAAIGLLGYSGYLLTQKGNSTLAETVAPAAKGTTGSSSAGNDQQAPAATDRTASAPEKSGPAATGETAPNGPADTDQSSTSKHSSADQPENGSATAMTTNEKQKNNKSVSVPAGNTVPLVSTGSKQTEEAKTKKAGKRRTNEKTQPVIVQRKYARQQPAKNAGGKLPAAGADGNRDQADMNEPAKELVKNPVIPGESEEKVVAAVTPAASDSAGADKKDSAIAKLETKEPVETVKTPAKKAGKSSKMKWALDLAVGGTGPVKGPFLVGTGEEKTAADPLMGSPSNQGGIWSPIQPPGAFGPIYVPRSDIKPGPAARIGVLAEWPVSKRSSISTGLQYQYQSNNIRIGYYKDTSLVFSNYAAQTVSVRAVYQGSQQKTFTNRFHYLQVPFNFQWQMNRSNKLQLLLNTGLTAGYMIATNGLVYDSLQGGIYYHDMNAFNRFQLTFSTGVAFRFGNSKLLQWSIGPEVSMGLRKQVKEEYDKKQYPLFLGISGKIYLPTKKK